MSAFDPNNDFYLTDVQMSQSGDLNITPGGDLALATGTDNLKQLVMNRLFTNSSEYLFGDFGSNVKSYVDSSDVARNSTAITHEIKTRLAQDSRIATVTAAQVSQTATGGIVASVSLVTVPGDSATLTVTSQDA